MNYDIVADKAESLDGNRSEDDVHITEDVGDVECKFAFCQPGEGGTAAGCR